MVSRQDLRRHHRERASKQSASRKAGVTDELSVAVVRSWSISLLSRGLKLGRKGAGPSACMLWTTIRDLTLLVTVKHCATSNPTLLRSRADA